MTKTKSQIGRGSKNKGKVGEREVVAFLQARGYFARRGQQYAGGGDSPDVVHNIPGVHIEVKRTEQLSLWAALDQAGEDAPAGDIPVVFYRKSQKTWVVIMDAHDFITIMQRSKK